MLMYVVGDALDVVQASVKDDITCTCNSEKQIKGQMCNNFKTERKKLMLRWHGILKLCYTESPTCTCNGENQTDHKLYTNKIINIKKIIICAFGKIHYQISREKFEPGLGTMEVRGSSHGSGSNFSLEI